MSRSLSPLKQRSITPPPKNQYDFINILPLNSKYRNNILFSLYFEIYILGNRSRSIDESFKKYEKMGENEHSNQQVKDTNNLNPDRVRRLINPFDKSQFCAKLTSNRRRWSHTFPES